MDHKLEEIKEIKGRKGGFPYQHIDLGKDSDDLSVKHIFCNVGNEMREVDNNVGMFDNNKDFLNCLIVLHLQ